MRNRTVFLLLILLIVVACYLFSAAKISLMDGLWGTLFVGVLGTVIGGIILSLIYFVLHDYVYKLPEIGGAWYFTDSIEKTSFNSYRGMQVIYLALIWNEGNRILGTAEKVSEITADGKQHKYIGDKRVQVNISGFITKNYLRDDKVTIHIEEFGMQRKSSSIHQLSVISDDLIKGIFTSTAANSTGLVVWRKGDHSNYKMEHIE